MSAICQSSATPQGHFLGKEWTLFLSSKDCTFQAILVFENKDFN